MTYVPTANLTPLYSFSQFTTAAGVSALQTALNAQPGVVAASVQVFADAQVAGNALVVVNDSVVFSVPPNSWVGFNNSQWTQYTNTKFTQTYTTYP